MPRGDHGGSSKGTGTRCVAANCGNTNSDGISMHSFPKDDALKRQWTDFVKTKRVWSGPTKFSALYSRHFTIDCFPFRYQFEKEQMGRTPQKVYLNKNAVPTIHAEPIVQTSIPSISLGRGPHLEMLSISEEAIFQSSPPKKMRRGYAKREAARIIAAQENVLEESEEHASDTDSHENSFLPNVEVHQPELLYAEFSCQVNIRPNKVSKRCQTNLRMCDVKDNHSKKMLVSTGVQTGLEVNKPEMKDAFQQVRPENLESKTKKRIFQRTFSDSSFQSNFTSPMKDDPNDTTYEPLSSPSTSIKESSINNDSSDLHVKEDLKYIVYENNLLELFTICRRCCTQTNGEIVHISGSMVKIQQKCNASYVWDNFQRDYFSEVAQIQKPVVLGGDGRSDTPGHSAKFGSYSMIDLEEGIVVDVQLVQSNEVKSSVHMEKEGLIRSIDHFKKQDIRIKTIITDGHVQIVKWIRENLGDTEHCFDVWHVAKGLKKKLYALSKEKDCSDLTPWIKSLINHLYWTAATLDDEGKETVIAKWLSVLNHIINIHAGHSLLFPKCKHGELEGRERQKKWLQPGTKVFEKLEVLLNSRQTKRDIPMLSPHHQTSALEGYHSVVNHFAPKMIGFSYHGMLCRLWLAALHFNENKQRKQAMTIEGQNQYRIVYPKYKKGEHTVRKVPVACQYNYIETLMQTTFNLAEVSHMNESGVQLNIKAPPPLCSKFERPDRDTAIQNLLSRFRHCQQSDTQCSPLLD